MPPDLNGLADIVVLTVKNAMAPAMERIALLEKDNADLRSQLTVVGGLRDRVVAVETKAAIPLPAPVLPEPVDLSPLQERVTVLEKDNADLRTQLMVVGELRDRVVVAETKSALSVTPPPVELPESVDLSPVLERLAVTEKACADVSAQLAVVTELRDRVVVVETKSALPAPLAPVIEKAEPVDLTPLIERLVAVEIKSSTVAVPQPSGLTSADVDLRIGERLAPLQASIADARERLAAVEVRQPIPGPAGKDGHDGTNGKDGAPGKDGADGMGWDDLAVEHDGERTFTVKMFRGERVKEAGRFTVPIPLYRGVYVEGQSYAKGDVSTWSGSMWLAKRDTTEKPGEGSKDWQLIVKRGRDGKDGDGGGSGGAAPVVKVK